jgi:hypothetical protein
LVTNYLFRQLRYLAPDCFRDIAPEVKVGNWCIGGKLAPSSLSLESARERLDDDYAIVFGEEPTRAAASLTEVL